MKFIGRCLPSLKTKFVAGVCGFGVFLVAGTIPSFATSLGVNLIVNAGAELSAGAPDFGTTLAPAGWTTTSNFSAVQYAAGGVSDLNPGDSVAIGGGSNYFAGGPNNALATAAQSIAFGDLAADVDAGSLSFVFSAFLGGFATQGDNMRITATFLSATSVPLLVSTLGPVSDIDRGDDSQLLFRTTSITAIPVGARSVNILMTATRLEGAYNDGYADNLSLVFQSSAAVPEPASFSLLGIGLMGMGALARLAARQARRNKIGVRPLEP